VTTTTKYEGPRVGVTGTDLARLRSQVPDDPIALPDKKAPCEGCGIAVHVTPESVVPDGRAFDPPGKFDKPPPPGEKWALCDACEAIRAEADEYATAHPALAARLGPGIARERLVAVLNGLAILGKKPPADIGLLLPRLHPVAHQLGYRNPFRFTKGSCNPHPWAHVNMTERADLRRAYVEFGRDRISQAEPPVAVKCPSGGCAMCGINEVARSALEVTRRGGTAAVAAAVWRAVFVQVGALGRPGPSMVHGHLCPQCSDAVDQAKAVGQSAMSESIRVHLRHGTNGDRRARRWEVSRSEDFPARILGWAATGQQPNTERWQHASRLIEDTMRTLPRATFEEVP
jgi:hypothetical protein